MTPTATTTAGNAALRAAVAATPPGAAVLLGPAPAAVPQDWPWRSLSHRVLAADLAWHVQIAGLPLGQAPVALLLHGTGASTHSWRELLPLLHSHFTLIVPDLPGHGFTARPAKPAGLSLPGMATALAALLQTLGAVPALIVGHSAGAAIGARLCLGGGAAPGALVSLNGAWFPPQGASGWWYPPLAKLMAINPLAPHLMSWQASQPLVLRRLLSGIGSPLNDEGLEWYRRLASSPQHVGAVIAMMAAWDLQPLLHDLPRFQPALHLVVGNNDKAVPPESAELLKKRLPNAHIHRLGGLGHLAHEEAPQQVAELILGLLGDPPL